MREFAHDMIGSSFLFIRLVIYTIAVLGRPADAQDPQDYEKWLKQERQKFQEFKDARDKEFTEFLKQEWKEMQSFKGLVPDEKPKPVKMPVYTPPVEVPKDTTSKPVRLKEPPFEKPVMKPEPEVKEKPVPEVKKNVNVVSVSFFESSLPIQFEGAIDAKLGTLVDKDAISAFWASLSRSNYEPFVAQAQQYKAKLRLNDWGYALLAYSFGQQLFHNRRNEAVLFAWFLLSKSGYEAKIGYSKERVFLLLPTKNSLYFVPYFNFENDKNRFYAVSLDPREEKFQGSLYTYEGKYPGADKLTDFNLKSLPTIRNVSTTKTLSFEYGRKIYAVPVKISKDALDFFLWYPQTNYEVYFDASPSAEAVASLFAGLKNIIQGKSEWEAVNILLRFCQTAFSYKTDDDQFGREKPFFPDETLYYDYSDCEDRAVLFAYLVRNLLGLDVVGLDYPAHIATAVRFSTEVAGDGVVFQGKRYVICDPTYINADVGACMTQFKSVNPNVIRIE